MFAKIKDFLKKLMKWLVPLIIVALIVLAVFFPPAFAVVSAYMATAWSAVSGWAATAWTAISNGAGAVITAATEYVSGLSFAETVKMALGAAIILDPEGVADAAGSLVESAGNVLASVASKLNLPLIIGGLGAAWLLMSNSGDDEIRSENERDQASQFRALQQ